MRSTCSHHDTIIYAMQLFQTPGNWMDDDNTVNVGGNVVLFLSAS